MRRQIFIDLYAIAYPGLWNGIKVDETINVERAKLPIVTRVRAIAGMSPVNWAYQSFAVSQVANHRGHHVLNTAVTAFVR